MVNVEKQPSKNDEENELTFKKGAFGKITYGQHKGLYCQVEGFDDDYRVIVKLAVKGQTISINQYFVTLVTKQEYEQLSKVISMSNF